MSRFQNCARSSLKKRLEAATDRSRHLMETRAGLAGIVRLKKKSFQNIVFSEVASYFPQGLFEIFRAPKETLELSTVSMKPCDV
jgi:hypothetical protein